MGASSAEKWRGCHIVSKGFQMQISVQLLKVIIGAILFIWYGSSEYVAHIWCKIRNRIWPLFRCNKMPSTNRDSWFTQYVRIVKWVTIASNIKTDIDGCMGCKIAENTPSRTPGAHIGCGKPLIVPLIFFLRSRHELDTKRLMVEKNEASSQKRCKYLQAFDSKCSYFQCQQLKIIGWKVKVWNNWSNKRPKKKRFFLWILTEISIKFYVGICTFEKVKFRASVVPRNNFQMCFGR